MFCPDCGQDNPGEARFCRACGAALAVSSLAESVSTEAAVALADYAGFWIRVAAWIIDVVIVWMGTSVFSALSLLGAGYASFLALLLGPLYFVLMTGMRGQTLGKMAVGVRVVGAEMTSLRDWATRRCARLWASSSPESRFYLASCG